MKRFFGHKKIWKLFASLASKMTFWIQKANRVIFASFKDFFMGESALESLDIIFFEKNILMVPRNFYWRRIFYEGFEWLFSNPFFDMT